MGYSSNINDYLDETKEGYKYVIEDLNNFNKNKIFNLTEKETLIIRKKYGFFDNGIVQTNRNVMLLVL